MWAWRYEGDLGVENLARIDLEPPRPGPGQALLRMQAAALNFRDLAIAGGQYHVGVSAPLIPLSDGAGEVVAVGPGVSRVAVGDLACPVYLPDWIDGPIGAAAARRRLGGPTDGVLAEFVCLPEAGLVRAPRHLSAVEAAALPVAYVTAWRSLFELVGLRPGGRLVVEGAGGVSVAAVQLAAAAGAEVLSITRSLRHAAALKALGARDVIVLGEDRDWSGDVARFTQGGADAVLVVSGEPGLGRAVKSVRPGGQVLLVGYAAGAVASLDIFDAIRRAVTIRVASAGARCDFEALVRLMELRGLRPPAGRVFEGDDPRPAMAALRAGGHLGKVVLKFA